MRFARTGSLLFIVLAGFSVYAQPLDLPYVSGKDIEIGSPYHSDQYSFGTQPCVSFEAPASKVGPQQVSSSLHLVDSARELESELDVKISESVKGGVFSESYSAQLVNTLKISAQTINAVVRVDVKETEEMARKFAPAAGIRELYTRNQREFAARCGDYFVAGFARGGHYYGALTISTKDVEDKASLKATFKTGAFTAESEGSMAASLRVATKDREVDIREYHAGGSGVPAASTLDELLANYRGFSAKVSTNPARVRVILKPYDDAFAETLPRPFGTAMDGVHFDIAYTRIELRRLAQNAKLAIANLNKLAYPPASRAGHYESVATDADAAVREITALGDECRPTDDVNLVKSCHERQGKFWQRRDAILERLGYAPPYWARLGTTTVRQISAGNREHLWAVSTKGTDGGYVPLRWTGTQWEEKKGGVTQLSVAGDGTVWMINSNQTPHSWNGDGWTTPESTSKLLRIDGNSQTVVWGLALNGHPWRFNTASSKFEPADRGFDAAASDLAICKGVRTAEGVFAVANGRLYHAEVRGDERSLWQEMPSPGSRVSSVACGQRLQLWVVTDAGVRRMESRTDWPSVEGGMTSVTIGEDGTVYGRDGQGYVYRLTELWRY